ncbi:MAG: hypothetical protein IIB09_05825 [Bacteroidetes bacterium]|nr:hypothetical protein [Bacteroidota bacterium]
MQLVPRYIACAFALLLLAIPAQAQLGFSFFPYVGYDLGSDGGGDGPLLGLGVEVPVTPSLLPVAAKIRASAETTFISEDNFSVVRFNGDAIVRLAAPTLPVSPYAKVGVIVERITNSNPAPSVSMTEIGAGLGAGAVFGKLFAEGTLGLGDVSDFRFAVGFRF